MKSLSDRRKMDRRRADRIRNTPHSGSGLQARIRALGVEVDAGNGTGENQYPYYWRDRDQWLRHRKEAGELSDASFNPKRSDPNYLVLNARRRIFSRWIDELPPEGLRILDVGGRLQPYARLFAERTKVYVGVDPILEGFVSVVGIGECLPFPDDSFQVVLCTQMLSYPLDPLAVAREIHRILVPGGVLLLSAPAIFPRYHDERWRFMPEGLRILLADFASVEIVPEGKSIAGFARLINLFADLSVKSYRVRQLLRHIFYPVINSVGKAFDRFSPGHAEFTTNYSLRARK